MSAASAITQALWRTPSPALKSMLGGTAVFADASVGTAKTVTVTGLTLSGADAGNYTLAATSISGAVGPAAARAAAIFSMYWRQPE